MDVHPAYAFFGTLEILFIATASCVLIASVAALIFSLIEQGEGTYLAKYAHIWIALVGFGLPVSIVSVVAGYATGHSRAPAVGSVLPAVLSLVGGLTIYVFGTEAKNKWIVGYCV